MHTDTQLPKAERRVQHAPQMVMRGRRSPREELRDRAQLLGAALAAAAGGVVAPSSRRRGPPQHGEAVPPGGDLPPRGDPTAEMSLQSQHGVRGWVEESQIATRHVQRRHRLAPVAVEPTVLGGAVPAVVEVGPGAVQVADLRRMGGEAHFPRAPGLLPLLLKLLKRQHGFAPTRRSEAELEGAVPVMGELVVVKALERKRLAQRGVRRSNAGRGDGGGGYHADDEMAGEEGSGSSYLVRLVCKWCDCLRAPRKSECRALPQCKF